MSTKKRRFADDGWAIWVDGDDRSTVYLNEWINPKGKSYVDIGRRIYGANEVNKINVYVPFEISKNEITDLSDGLKDGDVLRGLFNTNGIINPQENEYITELRYDNRLVSLIKASKNILKTKKVSVGTLITIPLQNIKQYILSNEAYIIFRIPHRTLDKIFSTQIDVQGRVVRL